MEPSDNCTKDGVALYRGTHVFTEEYTPDMAESNLIDRYV